MPSAQSDATRPRLLATLAWTLGLRALFGQRRDGHAVAALARAPRLELCDPGYRAEPGADRVAERPGAVAVDEHHPPGATPEQTLQRSVCSLERLVHAQPAQVAVERRRLVLDLARHGESNRLARLSRLGRQDAQHALARDDRARAADS